MTPFAQTSEIKQSNCLYFVGYVRQRFEVADAKATNEYAYKSFLSHVSSYSDHELTKEILINWIAQLYMKGNKAITVKRYLCRLHVAFQEWLKEVDFQLHDDPFDGLLDLATPEYQVDVERLQGNLNLIKKLTSLDMFSGADGKWTAILFWLLYNPDMSFDDVVKLTYENAPRYCPQSVEIIESMDSSHGRKYVFDLRQPDKRVAGMVRDVNNNVYRLLRSAGAEFPGGFTRESITSMWICAAFKVGVNVGDIKSIVKVIPKEYKILQSVEPTQPSEKDRHDIICRVADSINDITTRWYVLNMRDKNDPDNVKSFIRELFPALYDKIHFFYPTHPVFRESRRKKLVRQEEPFLPGLLFIKLRSDMVNSLMRKITAVAWGYKYSNTPGSPYSAISQTAMTDFQRHIGVFSDDVKVELVKNEKPLKEGQKVRILRSDLFGRLGEIESVKNTNGILYYTIQITEDTTVKITVKNLDGLMVESAV